MVAERGGKEMHSLIAKNNLILRSIVTLAKVHKFNEPVEKLCKKLTKVLTDFQETINIFRELPGLGAQVCSIISKDRIKFLIGVDDASMALSVLAGSERDAKAKFTYALSGAQLAKWVGKGAQKVQHSRAKRPHGDKGGKGNFTDSAPNKKQHGGKKAHFTKQE